MKMVVGALMGRRVRAIVPGMSDAGLGALHDGLF